jgi:hypothetical protein
MEFEIDKGKRFNMFIYKESPEIQDFSAEREGFEPPEPFSSTVFKTAAIDHSAISPTFLKMRCKYTSFSFILQQ